MQKKKKSIFEVDHGEFFKKNFEKYAIRDVEKKKCTEKGGLIPCLRLKKYEDLQTHAMKGYHSFNLSSWKVLRKMKKNTKEN